MRDCDNFGEGLWIEIILVRGCGLRSRCLVSPDQLVPRDLLLPLAFSVAPSRPNAEEEKDCTVFKSI